jgi:hypothetical protein
MANLVNDFPTYLQLFNPESIFYKMTQSSTYADSMHNNPLCRVTPIENIKSLPPYDKEKYKEMALDAAETVLGFFWL